MAALSKNSGTGSQQTRRMQPIVAWRALQRLIADPEQTEQVFVIIRAMSGNALEKAFRRFRSTATGQRILAGKRDLVSVLQNRERLRQYDSATLAGSYLKFVETEQISADGLVEASQDEYAIENEDLRRFGERMRDQHDLWHVVTGYGRDTFGEACLLAFTYAQTRNRGIGIIALMGMYKLSREIGPGVRNAMWQAYRDGRKAAWLPEQDWETLLAEPLETVRQQLRVPPPQKYRAVFQDYRLAAG